MIIYWLSNDYLVMIYKSSIDSLVIIYWLSIDYLLSIYWLSKDALALTPKAKTQRIPWHRLVSNGKSLREAHPGVPTRHLRQTPLKQPCPRIPTRHPRQTPFGRLPEPFWKLLLVLDFCLFHWVLQFQNVLQSKECSTGCSNFRMLRLKRSWLAKSMLNGYGIKHLWALGSFAWNDVDVVNLC